jgi:hypothetical protein
MNKRWLIETENLQREYQMQVTTIKTKDKLKFVGLCIYLFVISLSVPRMSFLLILLLPFFVSFFGYFRIPKYVLKTKMISISIVSLILFVFLNYYQLYFYGLDLEKGLVGIILPIFTIITFFLVGICLDLKKMPFFPYNLLTLNLSIFSGGIIFVFLSVAQYNTWGFSIKNIIIASRRVPIFWNNEDFINGPSLDMFSYLGLSLIGLLMVIIFSSIHSFGIFRKSILCTVIFLLVSSSAYSSIALGARTPIIVFLLSALATFVFTSFSNKDSKSPTIIYIYGTISFIVCLLIYALSENLSVLTNTFLELGIGGRLESDGLETPRYEVWKAVIAQMFDFPWGGRVMNISESYAHNIWLDQLYDAGILPMLLLLTFHLVQIPILIRFFRLKLPTTIRVFVLCTLIAFLAAFLQAPVIQASYIYFAISCFFFGSVARFTFDYEFLIASGSNRPLAELKT